MNKIPVRQTIAEAYRFTFAGLERVIGVIWLPIVLLTVGGYFVSGPYFAAMAEAMESGDFAPAGPALLCMIAFGAVAVVLTAMIGVAITREILSPLKRPLFLRFELGGAELRLAGAFVGVYLLMVVFFVAAVFIAVMLGAVLAPFLPAASPKVGAMQMALGLAGLMTLLLIPVMVYLLVRLSFLVVPSVVMDGGFGIERSWKLTKGNFWRIVGIALAVGIPVVIADVAVRTAVLGLDSLNPHFELLLNPAAQARHSAEQLRHIAANLPLLMGLSFVLAPFTSGLMFSAPAFAYRALTGTAPPKQ